ncbi:MULTISPECIES: TadE/TadG family type IV pilus assembly protein [unclassified Marinovum]
MIRTLKNSVARFRKDETGTATIDFVIVVSLFAIFLGASVELGYTNIRHAMLERGVDTTVRQIRLSTGSVPSYAELRTEICNSAGIIANCEENLRLEMKVVDPRAFVAIPPEADCQNAEETPQPVRQFQSGIDNDLMLLRACLTFKPVFPTTGVGGAMKKDDKGYVSIASTSAFVQEPR